MERPETRPMVSDSPGEYTTRSPVPNCRASYTEVVSSGQEWRVLVRHHGLKSDARVRFGAPHRRATTRVWHAPSLREIIRLTRLQLKFTVRSLHVWSALCARVEFGPSSAKHQPDLVVGCGSGSIAHGRR